MGTGPSIHQAPAALPLIRKERYHGPITARLRRRTLMLYLAICAIGLLPTLLDLSPVLQAAGLGLLFPGGGFVAAGGWWTLLLLPSLILFLVGLGAWLFTGNLLAPVVIWLGAAALSMLPVGDAVAAWPPYAVAALGAAALLRQWQSDRAKTHKAALRRDVRNNSMAAAFAAVDAAARPAPAMAERELSAEDLAALRYLHDLALQPLGRFDGFVRIDNFQPAALRYQLNHIQYTLSVAQCQYTPNFHGYLNQAQRYTIESLQLPEVCGYWKLESVWGNLRWNPDPVDTQDNIMLTGWSGHCLGTYAANTGDRRYATKGALKFRPFKRAATPVYAHDHHSFIESLLRNWNRAPYYLFPCEPNFVYAQCNLYAYGALVGYDRCFGTRHTQTIHDRFRQHFYEEFELLDGEIQPILSDLTGLSLIFKPTLVAAASNVPLLNVFDRALAKRVYALAKQEDIKLDHNGELKLNLTKLDMVDPGNYKAGTAFTLSWLAAAAREMGDNAVAELALKRLADTHERIDRPGVYMFKGLSTITAADYVLARILRKDFWYDTVVKGPAPSAFTGPLLTDCRYPDVLVARAWSPRGDDLDLVLYNGREAGEQRLKIERLQANQAYRAEGALEQEVMADAKGELFLRVHLNGRTAVRLAPSQVSGR